MTQIQLSGDERADRLVSTDPLAPLIGMVLDQQITIEQAFRGPAELVDRLGLTVPIDAHLLASMDAGTLAEAFSRKPPASNWASARLDGKTPPPRTANRTATSLSRTSSTPGPWPRSGTTSARRRPT